MALQAKKKISRSKPIQGLSRNVSDNWNQNLILTLKPSKESEKQVEAKVPKAYLDLCKSNKTTELIVPLSYQAFDCHLNIPTSLLAEIDISADFLELTIHLMPDAWRYLRNKDYQFVYGLRVESILELYCKAPPEPPITNWPADYFENVVGSWQGEPLVRGEQGDFPDRDSFD